MKLKFDKPLIAMFLGTLGAIPGTVYVEIMKFFHFTNISPPVAFSMMFIREGSMALGILAEIGYGSIIGLVIYYSVKILGTDYFPLKAMFLSMVYWAIYFIIFGTLTRNELLIQDAVGNYVYASGAAIAGLARGFLIKRYLF